MKYILLFMIINCTSFNAQVLHHQMLSSQGTTSRLESGMVITQTVGQVGALGSFNDYYRGIQGFQQLAIVRYAIIVDNELHLKIQVFPNPFNTTFNVIIPNSNTGDTVLVSIFDLMGRLVYNKLGVVQNEEITVDVGHLPVANYQLYILYKDKKYNAKIIKL